MPIEIRTKCELKYSQLLLGYEINFVTPASILPCEVFKVNINWGECRMSVDKYSLVTPTVDCLSDKVVAALRTQVSN